PSTRSAHRSSCSERWIHPVRWFHRRPRWCSSRSLRRRFYRYSQRAAHRRLAYHRTSDSRAVLASTIPESGPSRVLGSPKNINRFRLFVIIGVPGVGSEPYGRERSDLCPRPESVGMISLDEAVTARLESHGARFEVLVDPDAALAIRRGEFEG